MAKRPKYVQVLNQLAADKGGDPRHRLGGPEAVVVHVNISPPDPNHPNYGLDIGHIVCTWVTRGIEHTGVYPPEELRLVTPPTPPKSGKCAR